MTYAPSLIIAVEDELSGAVMSRLIAFSGRQFVIDRIINARGYGQLKAGIAKYRLASRVLPHVLLTDLDRSPCPPALLDSWGARNLPSQLLLRIAVREVEAWLLADREGLADFLHIDVNKMPHAPEQEKDPKQKLINLARKSKKRRMAQEIVPEPGSSAPIGPLYNKHFVDFVNSRWNIEQASANAPSLARALSRLSTFLIE